MRPSIRAHLRFALLLSLPCATLSSAGCSSGDPDPDVDLTTASGGGAANGGTASGGTASGGTGNSSAHISGGGTTASGGASSGGASSGGASSGGASSGGASSGGAASGGAASGGASSGGAPNIGPVVVAGDPGKTDVVFDVHADRNVHAISPLIYGTNGAPEIARNHQTVVRSGGNRLTAYNWENNASNAGSDWLFQNDHLMSSSDSPGKPISDGIREAASHGAASIVTIPIVDYVAADKNGGGDVRNSGADYLSTRFRRNHESKGSAFAATPNTGDADVYEDEFVAFLKAAHPNAPVLFSLDNEPDLWSHTHAEVHPDPVTYAELWDRNHRYAKAIKAVWPAAPVLGVVSYGYTGYVNLQNASDANNRDFIEWYLDQAKASDAADGKRVIDYLDVHWYPEAQGGGTRITGNDDSAAVAAAREQAPRSLWDSSYREQSWIVDAVTHGPIDLLHRLGAKIDGHYPGTKLAFTEWNFGGGGHISGAIAAADVLGIFGREGVDLATYWPLYDNERYAYAGFRAYRNYDGNGATFGDTSVQADSSDVPTATVYASIDASNTKRTVIVAINKATTEKTAGIRVYQSATYSTARVYVITSVASEVTAAAALTPVATNAFRYNMPAQSVSVIVPME